MKNGTEMSKPTNPLPRAQTLGESIKDLSGTSLNLIEDNSNLDIIKIIDDIYLLTLQTIKQLLDGNHHGSFYVSSATTTLNKVPTYIRLKIFKIIKKKIKKIYPKIEMRPSDNGDQIWIICDKQIVQYFKKALKEFKSKKTEGTLSLIEKQNEQK